MPKKNTREFPRQNVRARLYIRGKEEVYEIHSDWRGQTLLEYQKAFPLGEPAVDFLYGDYQILDHFHAWGDLLELADFIVTLHPYFIFLKQSIYQNDGHPDRSAADLKAYVTLKQDLSQLISASLNAGQGKEGPPPVNRFLADQRSGKFSFLNHLSYGGISSEFEPLEDASLFAAQGDHDKKDGPYPTVPSLERLAAAKRPLALFEVLYPQSLPDVLRFLTAQYLHMDIGFRACKNCGRFLAVSGGSKAEYCTRLTGNGKTCRQIGAVRAYEMKRSENPVCQLYTKAYKTHHARIRYGRLTKEEFAAWAEEARKRRDQCLDGEITLAEFTEFTDWLKN
ncbi:MAG: DUF6076 domain-containing protein [Peptococcaceae bacterium]|jgi:hypothetical protein|nr:DUF6076 domain-containing protein [Peptococcaceae bacterium]